MMEIPPGLLLHSKEGTVKDVEDNLTKSNNVQLCCLRQAPELIGRYNLASAGYEFKKDFTWEAAEQFIAKNFTTRYRMSRWEPTRAKASGDYLVNFKRGGSNSSRCLYEVKLIEGYPKSIPLFVRMSKTQVENLYKGHLFRDDTSTYHIPSQLVIISSDILKIKNKNLHVGTVWQLSITPESLIHVQDTRLERFIFSADFSESKPSSRRRLYSDDRPTKKLKSNSR